jgi:hypothetical protein
MRKREGKKIPKSPSKNVELEYGGGLSDSDSCAVMIYTSCIFRVWFIASDKPGLWHTESY